MQKTEPKEERLGIHRTSSKKRSLYQGRSGGDNGCVFRAQPERPVKVFIRELVI